MGRILKKINLKADQMIGFFIFSIIKITLKYKKINFEKGKI